MEYFRVFFVLLSALAVLVLPAAAGTQRPPGPGLIVEKQTHPDGSLATFTFTGDVAGNIGDGQQLSEYGYLPGTYHSTEIIPQGWELASIVCDHPSGTGDVSTATATFDVDYGDIVTCVFTNRELIFADGFEDGTTDAWGPLRRPKSPAPQDL